MEEAKRIEEIPRISSASIVEDRSEKIKPSKGFLLETWSMVHPKKISEMLFLMKMLCSLFLNCTSSYSTVLAVLFTTGLWGTEGWKTEG